MCGRLRRTTPLLARELGDIHEQCIWRFPRTRKINLSGRKPWCESNDPEVVSHCRPLHYAAGRCRGAVSDEKPVT
jgi:hypothetical protein